METSCQYIQKSNGFLKQCQKKICLSYVFKGGFEGSKVEFINSIESKILRNGDEH